MGEEMGRRGMAWGRRVDVLRASVRNIVHCTLLFGNWNCERPDGGICGTVVYLARAPYT